MKVTDPTKLNLFKKLGVETKNIKKYQTIDELIKYPPLMTLGQVRQDVQMTLDNNPIKVKKGTVLAMPLSSYLSMKKTSGEKKKTILKPFRTTFDQIFKRYRGQDLTNKKILIWRGGGFGDLLFIQPIIKHLKRLYPSCEITIASYVRFLNIYGDYPDGLISHVLPVPFSHKFLLDNHYHLTFEGAIERCKEAETLNVYDLLAKVAGLKIDMTDDYYDLELIPNQKIVDEIKNLLPNNFVIIQMKASSPIRMMTDKKWVKIIEGLNAIGKKVVLIDKAERSSYYDNFIKANKLDPTMVKNCSGISKSINHAVAIMSFSDGVIGVDSSFTHMAAALKKPVVGIYASFLGENRMKYYKKAAWVEPTVKLCGKQPCFYHSEERFLCPTLYKRTTPCCFDNIDENEVVEKYKNLTETN